MLAQHAAVPEFGRRIALKMRRAEMLLWVRIPPAVLQNGIQINRW